jgi:hypothetical protein
MTWFLRSFAGLALVAGAHLAAQCPRTSASFVAGTHVSGPVVVCGSGITIEVGGVTFKSPSTGCPLYVVFTPDHEVPQPANADTYTQSYARVEAYLFRLQCLNHYFLFIGIGSSCVHLDKSVTGTYDRLVTLNCQKGQISP